jgi:hypothetical protein
VKRDRSIMHLGTEFSCVVCSVWRDSNSWYILLHLHCSPVFILYTIKGHLLSNIQTVWGTVGQQTQPSGFKGLLFCLFLSVSTSFFTAMSPCTNKQCELSRGQNVEIGVSFRTFQLISRIRQTFCLVIPTACRFTMIEHFGPFNEQVA